MTDLSPLPAPDSDTRRIFLAVELSPDVHGAVAELSSRLQKGAQFTPARLVWAPESNLHVILYFLGPVSRAKTDALAREVQNYAPTCAPFTLDLRGVGIFPKQANVPPKVLWIGVHKPPAGLLTLRDACATAIRRAGLEVPDQDFLPHITLARFKSTKGLTPLMTQLRNHEFAKLGKSPVAQVTLMESITGGGQARYEAIARFPLADPKEG